MAQTRSPTCSNEALATWQYSTECLFYMPTCIIAVWHSFHARYTTIRTLPAAVDVQNTVCSTLNASCTVPRYSTATWLLSASIIQHQVRRRLTTAHSATVVSVQLVRKLTCSLTWQRCKRNTIVYDTAVEFLHYLQSLDTEVYRPSVLSSPLSCALWRWDSLGVATWFPILKCYIPIVY